MLHHLRRVFHVLAIGVIGLALMAVGYWALYPNAVLLNTSLVVGWLLCLVGIVHIGKELSALYANTPKSRRRRRSKAAYTEAQFIEAIKTVASYTRSGYIPQINSNKMYLVKGADVITVSMAGIHKADDLEIVTGIKRPAKPVYNDAAPPPPPLDYHAAEERFA